MSFSKDVHSNAFLHPPGGFLPKQPIKEEYFYDKFHTTSFGIDLTTEAPVKLNATHGAVFKNKNGEYN